MKYAWIDAQRGAFDLSELCRVLGVSISGYRAWQRGGTPRRQCLSDAQLLALRGDPRRGQGRLRQPAAGARAAGPGLSGQQRRGWSG